MLSYYEIVQVYFTQVTGRVTIFSGRDMALLESWRDQGATAASVCRGVRDAAMHMERGDSPPRDLYNCRAFIEPHVEQARHTLLGIPAARREGGAARSLDMTRRDVLDRARQLVERAGHEAEDEGRRAAYREIWYAIKDIEQNAAPEEYYSRLLDLETVMADRVFETLSPELQVRIDAEVHAETGELARHMTDEAWSIHVAARRRRILTRELELISLLGG